MMSIGVVMDSRVGVSSDNRFATIRAEAMLTLVERFAQKNDYASNAERLKIGLQGLLQ